MGFYVYVYMCLCVRLLLMRAYSACLSRMCAYGVRLSRAPHQRAMGAIAPSLIRAHYMTFFFVLL